MELVFNDAGNPFLASEKLFEFLYEVLDFLQFVFYLLPLQSGKLLKAHVQNRGCLQVGELVLLLQGRMSGRRIFGLLDGLDDGVDVVERFFKAKQNMLARFGFFQIKLRAASHHLSAVSHKRFENAF